MVCAAEPLNVVPETAPEPPLLNVTALLVAEATAAVPEMLMAHVPEAPVPVADGAPRLVKAAAEVVAPVPPLATGRVPVTCEVRLTPVKAPPRAIVPVAVIGPPVRVMPLTDPVVATLVTVPVFVVYPAGLDAA